MKSDKNTVIYIKQALRPVYITVNFYKRPKLDKFISLDENCIWINFVLKYVQ